MNIFSNETLISWLTWKGRNYSRWFSTPEISYQSSYFNSWYQSLEVYCGYYYAIRLSWQTFTSNRCISVLVILVPVFTTIPYMSLQFFFSYNRVSLCYSYAIHSYVGNCVFRFSCMSTAEFDHVYRIWSVLYHMIFIEFWTGHSNAAKHFLCVHISIILSSEWIDTHYFQNRDNL